MCCILLINIRWKNNKKKTAMCCFVTATARTRPTICSSPPAITQIGKHLRLGMNKFLELISWLINNPNRKTFIQCGRWTCFSNADEDDGMMLKLMLPQYSLTDEIWYLQDREDFCILGKKLLSNTCKKEKVLCTSKNEGKDNILGILTKGLTHFRKCLVEGIIQKHSRILEIFSLTFIKNLWDGLEIGSFVGTWQSLNSKTICNFFLNILIAVFFYRYLFIL